MSSVQDRLARLGRLEADHTAQRNAITAKVESEGRDWLTQSETREFRKLTRKINAITAETQDLIDDVERMGGTVADLPAPSADSEMRVWARQAADAIWRANHFNGEARAITSSSIDLPALVLPQVVAMERPKRIIDLLVDRQESPSNAFEFWQQTVRTNNATMVADLATKPTSQFTVTPVEDRLRVLAHLSEPIPNRLWQDYTELQSFLISELYQGLLDALEQQVLNGDGTGENLTGIVHASGTTAVAFETDVLTTLRSALTTFENAGVQPTGWVLNPADAAAIDLLRESETPSLFVTQGYQHGPAGSANIFGDVPRLVSPRVPAGTALLADWSKVRLFTRGGIVTQLNPFAGFATNTTLLRSEMRIGQGLLRPDAFAVIALHS